MNDDGQPTPLNFQITLSYLDWKFITSFEVC